MTTGTRTQRTLPQTTTDIGGRSSKTVAGALSLIVSVVKQPCLAKDVIENFLAPRIQRDQRQPDLRRRQKPEPGHHVFERDRIRVEKDRLRQREQLEVLDQTALRRATVVRRHHEERIDAGLFRRFRKFRGLLIRAGTSSGNDRNAMIARIDRGLEELRAFLQREARRLASGSGDD